MSNYDQDMAQVRMREDYINPPRNIEFNPNGRILTYKQRLKRAGEEGLLLFVKWALALALAFFAINYLTGVINGATNGTQAVIYLNELQSKGYLPKIVNGQIPPKEIENATPNPIK